MARVKSALFQSGKGSIGNIIFSDYVDGDMIARSKPQDVANPNTSGQQNQRGIFTLIQHEARDLLQLLRESFEPLSNDQNGYTSKISHGIKTFKELSADYADYCEQRLVTRGSRPQSNVLSTDNSVEAVSGDELQVDVTWVAPSGSMEEYENDDAVIVLYDPFNRTFFEAGADKRLDGGTVVTFDENSAPSWGFAYLFFRDPVTGKVTDSQYLGAFEDQTTAYQYSADLPNIEPPVEVPSA